MQTTYYHDDDILVIKFSDKPIVRECSQNWNINLSYAEDGSLVEMVILDAREIGIIPVQEGERRVA